MNNTVQALIYHYPLIVNRRNNYFTHNEIVSLLDQQYGVKLVHYKAPDKFISLFLSQMNKGLVNKEFLKYKLVLNINDDISKYMSKLLPLDVGLYVTYSNTIIEDRYIVTKDNIMSMPTLKGAIIAKWLLRIYDISDVAFITIYKDSYIKTNNKIPSVSEESMAFIENIYDNIIPFFTKMKADLKNKFILLRDHYETN